MTRQLVVVGACLALSLGAASGCGGGQEAQSEEKAPTTATTERETSTQAVDEPVIDVIEVGGAPMSVALGDGTVWVAQNQGDSVVSIDAESKTANEPVPVGTAPASVAAAGGAIWVANTFDDSVTRIDSGSGEVVG
jgi:streptogramin lyase